MLIHVYIAIPYKQQMVTSDTIDPDLFYSIELHFVKLKEF